MDPRRGLPIHFSWGNHPSLLRKLPSMWWPISVLGISPLEAREHL
jgi:hypothetical protein